LNQTKLWEENPIKLGISPVDIYEHKAIVNILEEENLV